MSGLPVLHPIPSPPFKEAPEREDRDTYCDSPRHVDNLVSDGMCFDCGAAFVQPHAERMVEAALGCAWDRVA